MLKGIPKIISPELLKVLSEMGHSDTIVLADGNFPAETMGKNAKVIRADGHGVCELLDAILTLFPLDTYVAHPVKLMAVMAGGIVILSDMVWRSALLTGGGRRRNNDRDNGGQLLVLAVGVALAVLAPLAAAIVQMAVSREREYLADASAVEFTRNPTGLAEALQILAGDRAPMPECKATENMYIVNPKLGLRGGADSLFSTHPPIGERIERLRKLL